MTRLPAIVIINASMRLPLSSGPSSSAMVAYAAPETTVPRTSAWSAAESSAKPFLTSMFRCGL